MYTCEVNSDQLYLVHTWVYLVYMGVVTMFYEHRLQAVYVNFNCRRIIMLVKIEDWPSRGRYKTIIHVYKL